MSKTVTNHQLATAFAELITQSEKAQKSILEENRAVLKRIKEVEQNISIKLQGLQSVNITPNLDDLRLLERTIDQTSTNASKRIKKSLNSLVLHPYMIGMLAMILLFAFVIMWYSFNQVASVKAEMGELKSRIEQPKE